MDVVLDMLWTAQDKLRQALERSAEQSMRILSLEKKIDNNHSSNNVRSTSHQRLQYDDDSSSDTDVCDFVPTGGGNRVRLRANIQYIFPISIKQQPF